MPKDHGSSVKNDKQYERLRKKGMMNDERQAERKPERRPAPAQPDEGDEGPGDDPAQEGPVPAGEPPAGADPMPIGDEPGARHRPRKEDDPPYEQTGEYPES
jgi:hypothetical protein